MDLEIFPLALQQLLVTLHNEFEGERQTLLAARKERQARFDKGEVPKFSAAHPAKTQSWTVAPIPKDMLDRRVEITGPISSAKMVINMLSENSEGEIANTAMLDFEDSMAPTWGNVVQGLKNIIAVAHGNLTYVQPASGDSPEKIYQLNPHRMAHPMVRVRGLHLQENSFVSGPVKGISASILDLAATAFHTAKLFL